MGHLQVKREIFYHLALVELSAPFEYSSSKLPFFKPVSKSCGHKKVSALFSCMLALSDIIHFSVAFGR